ncbi:MAG: hypothetical protein B5M53_01570 [Candidatus Cloacimonas sp. 4484_209]|nr:MAG: hypothetical protein B5M53_01570 [Candidatus Cloacimonas sp. 4484_209]
MQSEENTDNNSTSSGSNLEVEEKNPMLETNHLGLELQCYCTVTLLQKKRQKKRKHREKTRKLK